MLSRSKWKLSADTSFWEMNATAKSAFRFLDESWMKKMSFPIVPAFKIDV